MKSLKTVQKLAKAGRIISTIVFVFAVIGFAACAVCAVIAGAVGDRAIELLTDAVEKYGEKEITVTLEYLLTSLICGAVICAAEAVLAKFAEHYFKRELSDGTPFTFGGAAELKRLGLLAIFIPIGAYAAAGIVYGIMKLTYPELNEVSYSNGGTIMLGVMLLVGSCLCKLGAEQAERNAAPAETKPETEL